MVFKAFQKLFITLKLILKILTETLIPFSVIGRFSLVPSSHWLQGKCARIRLSQAASGMLIYDFTESQPPSCKHFCVKITTLGSLK
jgi:hypothetical protein